MWKIFAFVKILPSLRPTPSVMRKLLVVLFVAGVGVGAFLWGRAVSQAAPNDPRNAKAVGCSSNSPDSVVAYLKGTIPITRQELGEYLILRQGADRIDNLVNRRIIELACREKDIYVSDAEVDAQFADDLRALNGNNVSTTDLAVTIFRRFNKTLYEWKEDVIRPRIAMKKLLRSEVTVTDEEVRNAYEMRYGPKVECRMIVMRPHSPKHWGDIREKAVVSKDAFYRLAADKEAQIIDVIRERGGQIPPIYRHFGEPAIEKAAFALRVGEVSQIIEMPDETAVLLLCENHIPMRSDTAFDERMKYALQQDVTEVKINQKIPEKLQELRRIWAPEIYLPRPNRTNQMAMNGSYNNSQAMELTGPPPEALQAADKGAMPPPPLVIPPPVTLPPVTPPGDPIKLQPPPADAVKSGEPAGSGQDAPPSSGAYPFSSFGTDTSSPPVFPVPVVPALRPNPNQ
jgi:hypothetical protein